MKTFDGLIVGTCAYMSPEQARGLPVDERTDIWGFGCLLFELLAGKRAFAAESISETIAAVLEREPDWAALPDTTPHSIRRSFRFAAASAERRPANHRTASSSRRHSLHGERR